MTVAECLGLDKELAHDLAQIYQNRAKDIAIYGFDKMRATVPASWLSAGFLCRAASYASVAEEDNLSEWFKRAAEGAQAAFREQLNGNLSGPPMWLVSAIEMRLLGHLQATILGDLDQSMDLLPPSDASRLRAVIAGILYPRNDIGLEIYFGLSRPLGVQGIPVGRLGIPLFVYTGLARYITRNIGPLFPDERPVLLLNELRTYLNDRLAIAQKDARHWRSFHSAMLPIDPEVLSLFVMSYLPRPGLPPLEMTFREDEPSFAYFQVAMLLINGTDDQAQHAAFGL